MDLLDNDSQALLSKLVPERPLRKAVEEKQAAKAILDLNEGRTLSNAVRVTSLPVSAKPSN